MKREDLEKLGLTEEQITSALDLHHEEITQTKEELKKAKDDLKLAQGKVAETEGKLKDLAGLDKEGYPVCNSGTAERFADDGHNKIKRDPGMLSD